MSFIKPFVCLVLTITASYCVRFNKPELRVLRDYMKDIYERNPTDSHDKKWFSSSDDSYGYVAYDASRNNIVVALRGTATQKNMLNNFKLQLSPYQGCRYCKVHEGFFKTYSSSKKFIMDAVQRFHAEHPSATLYVTGYSLGSVQATYCAVDLHNAGLRPNLLTFGSPRPGNKEFANYTNHLLLHELNYRVTYANDAVTAMPLKSLRYQHVGTDVNFKLNRVDYTIELPLFSDKTYRFRPYNLFDHMRSNYEKLN